MIQCGDTKFNIGSFPDLSESWRAEESRREYGADSILCRYLPKSPLTVIFADLDPPTSAPMRESTISRILSSSCSPGTGCAERL